jgi:thiosulfate reductase cytochrome b subunit
MSGTLILFKKVVHWLLFLVTIVYLISGLGITEYQILESVTFGFMSRNLSFRIHDSLLAPFVAFLILHIVLVIATRKTPTN